MLNNEVFIKFTIQNFNKSHSEITRYLKINPSKTWSKGDNKIKEGTIKYKSNGWEIGIERKNVLHIDALLDEIITILLPIKNQLTNLDKCSKKISIIVYAKKIMPSFVFNKEIISFLNNASIELEQDIYCLS